MVTLFFDYLRRLLGHVVIWDKIILREWEYSKNILVRIIFVRTIQILPLPLNVSPAPPKKKSFAIRNFFVLSNCSIIKLFDGISVVIYACIISQFFTYIITANVISFTIKRNCNRFEKQRCQSACLISSFQWYKQIEIFSHAFHCS